MTVWRWRHGAAGVLSAALLALVTAGCGDGTPAFCEPLGSAWEMRSVASAIEKGELDKARAEAERLGDLAQQAPSGIRADFAALADAVVDIVELLETEDAVGVENPDEPGGGAAEVERRRGELNARFGELDRRSIRVSNWAARECGLDTR
jgi:hypothetical protein